MFISFKRMNRVIPLLLSVIILVSMITFAPPAQAAGPKVVINPGHLVGRDPGAVNNNTGVREADLNAQVAAKVVNRLKSEGYDVYLTQPVEGCSIPALCTTQELVNAYNNGVALKTTGQKVNQANPDLCLSIHFNAGSSTASGYEFYWSSYRPALDTKDVYRVDNLWPGGDWGYRDKTPCSVAVKSRELAGILEKNYQGIGIPFRRTVERDDYLPAHVNSPTVLIEGGFVSNDSESRLLASDAYQNKMADRTVKSINDFFGRETKPQAKPTAKELKVTSVSDTSFKIELNGVTETSVSKIVFPVWTSKNGQDDLRWYEAKRDGEGIYSFVVNNANHNNESGLYIVHAYAQTFSGELVLLKYTDYTLKPQEKPSAEAIEITNLTSDGFRATVKGLKGNVTGVTLPTWSSHQGQDDLKWYTAKKDNDGNYYTDVKIADHKGDRGVYHVHAYANTPEGKLVGLYNSSTKVPEPAVVEPDESSNFYAENITSSGFTLQLTGVPREVSGVYLPTWSDNNGQDDLVWYWAKRVSDGVYTAKISTDKHKGDTGRYHVHAYYVSSKGRISYHNKLDVAVPEPEVEEPPVKNELSFSNASGKGFDVKLTDIDGKKYSRIYFPTWSEDKGQDDIVWYNGKKVNQNEYTLTVSTSNHLNTQGIYHVHAYGKLSNGSLEYIAGATVKAGEPGATPPVDENQPKPKEVFTKNTTILGPTQTSKQRFVEFFNQNASFPKHYVDRGVNLEQFVQMYMEESAAEGVRGDLAFAQMLHETGYLRFGGDVKIQQFNFAGLGATGGGVPGADFRKYGDDANGIRMGIRAQVQHLKGYTSTPELSNPCVDPRYGAWLAGRANTIGELTGTWATDPHYADKLVNIMNKF